jgi:hypothetical protein
LISLTRIFVRVTIDVEALRRCGYSRCARPLAYGGQGRPPEYCADRRWEPDQRTCKQLAAAERAGERAAGLDAPLDAFRAAGDRLIPAAQELARHLGEVVAAIVEVRDAAVSRAAEADHAALAAVERAQVAEAATARAVLAQRTAETQRDRAVQAAAAAEERGRAARAEADSRVAEAYQQVAAADHARGRAEATAHADRAAQAAAAERVAELSTNLATAERIRLDLTAALADAQRAVDTERVRRLNETGDLAVRLAAALARADAAEADGDRYRAENAGLRTEIAAAQQRGTEAALARYRPVDRRQPRPAGEIIRRARGTKRAGVAAGPAQTHRARTGG